MKSIYNIFQSFKLYAKMPITDLFSISEKREIFVSLTGKEGK